MIAYIKGILTEKNPTTAIIETGGVGYNLFISLPTYEKLPSVGDELKLSVYQHVREDALLLFGFLSEQEKRAFLDLLTVSGIGPKLALNILSSSNVNDLYYNIANENQAALTRIQGLGKKTAQRLIIELKDKAANRIGTIATGSVETTAVSRDEIQAAILALESLGYSRSEAQESILKAARVFKQGASVEELLKEALKG
ncbi:Holliday junction DNA helicase RuvA [candidate division KSB1 bacterium RBG_16_48_16]|nr:MAG: Holliday junction DNA helicase RuvA [candidate division KSB1 bacterium RBG_16_48_16]